MIGWLETFALFGGWFAASAPYVEHDRYSAVEVPVKGPLYRVKTALSAELYGFFLNGPQFKKTTSSRFLFVYALLLFSFLQIKMAGVRVVLIVLFIFSLSIHPRTERNCSGGSRWVALTLPHRRCSTSPQPVLLHYS